MVEPYSLAPTELLSPNPAHVVATRSWVNPENQMSASLVVPVLPLQVLPFERPDCLGASAAADDVAKYTIHDISYSGLNNLLGLWQVATIRVTNRLGLRQENRISIDRVDFGNKVGLNLVTTPLAKAAYPVATSMGVRAMGAAAKGQLNIAREVAGIEAKSV